MLSQLEQILINLVILQKVLRWSVKEKFSRNRIHIRKRLQETKLSNFTKILLNKHPSISTQKITRTQKLTSIFFLHSEYQLNLVNLIENVCCGVLNDEVGLSYRENLQYAITPTTSFLYKVLC